MANSLEGNLSQNGQSRPRTPDLPNRRSKLAGTSDASVVWGLEKWWLLGGLGRVEGRRGGGGKEGGKRRGGKEERERREEG